MPDEFTDHHSPSKAHPPPSLFPTLLLLTVTTLGFAATARAEIRIVTAQGQHRMGDRDTREDAVRLATEAAKRNALEQVATYLESITVIEDLDVTRDEIRTYTAGLVMVLDQRNTLTLDGDTVVVTVDLTTQIDTEEVAQAIAALRENEDARNQLAALKEEIDDLHKELESANQALAAAATPEQVQEASQQRQDLLNRVQSNAMVSQAWTDWVVISPVVYPYPWVDVAQTQALLNAARSLYPTSPHVPIAQQIIVIKQPPPSPQPVPSTAAAQPAPQQPGTRSMPLTLNEISPSTQTTAPHLGNQPAGANQINAPPSELQNLTDVHQLNPLLPPNGQRMSPGTRSARRLQEFLPPSSPAPSGGQPPIARRLPPTIHQIHPPLPPQVPRVPYQVAPRGSGGGPRGGGGGHGGGGGRGGGRGR